MLISNCNLTIDFYIKALDQYDYPQLCAQPAPGSWSLGQMYMHLLADTAYYLEQIKICAASNDQATAKATATGKALLLQNNLPDEALAGSPDNASVPQPASKEQLRHDLIQLKAHLQAAANLVTASAFRGKTKHPGLGYFSAPEWLQFADMHLRHHLRQKSRIDNFLAISQIG